MIKGKQSCYVGGRKAGHWWKWKLDPMTADCVLIYAQAGHGRRASLHSDYTLACWNQDNELVPVAKAYSGLTDAELKDMDQWIRKHTLQKFGPVRQVEAFHVFEIGFEGDCAFNPAQKRYRVEVSEDITLATRCWAQGC